MQEAQKNRYFFLVAATIMFQDVVNQQAVGAVHSIPMNTILPKDEDTRINAKDLGTVQRHIQVQLHKRMGEEQVAVVDVVISSISFLGEMTNEEFYGQGVTAVVQPGE